MFKFQLDQKVLVKSLNKEGIIVSQRISLQSRTLYETTYVVSVLQPLNEDFGIVTQYMGLKPVMYTVSEYDLLPIADNNATEDKMSLEEMKQFSQKCLEGKKGIFSLKGDVSQEDMDKMRSLWDAQVLKSPKECQCGKEKHGFASHSSWCDLFS